MRQNWLLSIWYDGWFAIRSLTRRPWGFMAAVSMLGLAVGITTAMFTIVDALILRPVPFKDAQNIAEVFMGDDHGGPGVRPAVLRAWQQSPAFAAVESANSQTVLVGTGAGEAVRVAARVTPGIFELPGAVRPVHGRLFDASEGRPGSDDRVLLSEDLWRPLFHADPGVIGRTITLDGEPVVVVGILPSEFRFPNWNTQIWRAASFETSRYVTAYVRFAPAVPRADALRMATSAAREVDPGTARLWAQTRPLAALQLDSYYQRALPLLAGGVVLLFLVLCANVSSLLLAGQSARRREIGTRAALGAPRSRLVRQAFLESATVGLGGALFGAVLGWALVSAARAVLPQAALVHSLNPLDLDMRAIAVTSVAGLVATLAAGVLPAVAGTRVDISKLLQRSGRSRTGNSRERVFGLGLLAGQIALSCTLLFGTTQLVRSFVNLVTEDRGLDTNNVLIARVSWPASLATGASRMTAERALSQQVLALPGVQRASWSYGTPPGGGINPTGEWTSDLRGAQPVTMKVDRFLVDAEFFGLYGIPLLRGRVFLESDDSGATIVSERFARTLWPESDPVGRRFSFAQERFHVVGLVRDIHYPSLDQTLDAPQLYSAYRGGFHGAALSLRCDSSCPDSLLVRQRLMTTLPGVRISSVTPLENAYFRELARPRAAAALAFAFSATALVAAATGVFTLSRRTVARRRREFGIRAALGASPADLRRLVWHDGLVVTLYGIAGGLLAGTMLGRGLTSLLFKVETMDPLSWGIVTGVLAITIAAASWHPTRTAVRTAPVLLLREE